jgi:hypothetical protein
MMLKRRKSDAVKKVEVITNERGKTVQLWLVADGRSDAVVPLRSERGSDAHLRRTPYIVNDFMKLTSVPPKVSLVAGSTAACTLAVVSPKIDWITVYSMRSINQLAFGME